MESFISNKYGNDCLLPRSIKLNMPATFLENKIILDAV